MAATLLLRDDLFLRHDPGPGHPENAARLAATLADLDAHPLPGVQVGRPARDATRAELLAVHTAAHVRRLEECAGRRVQLDPDTATGPDSVQVARRAAGAALQAAQAVCSGAARGAFVLARPPGHHAEPAAAMGFCLYNNVALAAEHALRELGCRRVAVLDPDIHHGNGTQRAFWSRADVLYVSSHRYPFYPGSGWYDEVGAGPGAGFTLNLPLPMGLSDADFLHVWSAAAGPVVRQFAPDLLLVSAGFDTWHADPIGDLNLTGTGFSALWELFRNWSEHACPGRIAAVLEGGYDPAGVAAGVRAALAALSAPRPGDEAGARAACAAEPCAEARRIVERSRAVMAPYWSALRG